MSHNNEYYLGNPNLPRPNAEFQWTEEMLRNMKKCKEDILYFAEEFFYIINLDSGKQKIKLHKCQKKILRKMRDNRFVVLLASRQVGKTTLMTIFALHLVCFNEHQNIIIVANKEATAINIFKKIRIAYEQLPNYLKPGAATYGKTSMELGNGSSIGITTTSSDAARGSSANCILLDEMAFIDRHIMDEFWNSVYPVISSSKKAKIFIASTPNGTKNLFYTLYHEALKGDTGWAACRIDWHEIPGRDEKWKQETIKTIGSQEAFDQEFGNSFLETGESSLDKETFDQMRSVCTDPTYILEDGKYFIWKEPQKSRVYVAGVDTGEGVNKNASCIQIFDITDLTNIEQVAVYNNKSISPYSFATKVNEILEQWGKPYALIERNNCGAEVVDLLVNQYNYPRLVDIAPRGVKLNSERRGVIAHTNTKYMGIVNMRYWVNEKRVVRFNDRMTVHEFSTFVRHDNGTWSAQTDQDQDDRVMSTVWALCILESTIVSKYFEIIKVDSNNRPTHIKPLEWEEGSQIGKLPTYKSDPQNNYLPIMLPGDHIDEDGFGDQLATLGWEQFYK